MSRKYFQLFKLIVLVIQVLYADKMYAQIKNANTTVFMQGPQVGIAYGFTYGYDSKPGIFIPELNSMNVHLTKLYLFWQQLEPEKGQFHWNAVDSFLKQINLNDEALISIFSSSTWGTKTIHKLYPLLPQNQWMSITGLFIVW